jgi:hypothetical protein
MEHGVNAISGMTFGATSDSCYNSSALPPENTSCDIHVAAMRWASCVLLAVGTTTKRYFWRLAIARVDSDFQGMFDIVRLQASSTVYEVYATSGGSRSHVLTLTFKECLILCDFKPPQRCTRSSLFWLGYSALSLKHSDKELKTARCILLPIFCLGWGLERHSRVKARRVCSSQSDGGCSKGIAQLQTSFIAINDQSLS